MLGVSSNDGKTTTNSFSKTICSICYEDLKPIIEDLQSISICGHVFHELCLQQWFEYCPNVKKRSCPICKQTCTASNVGRLYFQSVGDANDAILSQKECPQEQDPEELRKEVNRLEGKVMAMASTLEKQQKEFTEVKDQLFSCKEQLKTEVALKNEAITQTTTSQQLLRRKSEDLDKSTLEQMRLQERNMALAKEIAAFKLASDLDLEENEVMRLASLGNDVGSRETVDVLRKSLVIRNKSYKDLMAKCNNLGRGEARSLRKLEKANEKIKKLKLRVLELESAAEIKENVALRVLRDQDVPKTDSNENPGVRPTKKIKLEEATNTPYSSFCSRNAEPCIISGKKSNSNGTGHNDDQEICPSIKSKNGDMLSSFSSMAHGDNKVITQTCNVPVRDASSDSQNDVVDKNEVDVPWATKVGGKEDRSKELPVIVDDEVIYCGDNNPINAPSRLINDTRSNIPSSQPGSRCFSGGLLGPDGTSWHLGKWCKKDQSQGPKGSSGLQGLTAGSGGLIAVGADGRGGRIKVMRSLEQSSLDIKGNVSFSNKRKQGGTKPNKLHPQGHLQIDHFFRKADQ